MQKTGERYDSLTLLRGLAALMIVFHHTNSDCIPTLPAIGGAFSWILWNLRNVGWTAVDLFFVLSGFFFSKSVIEALDNDRFKLRDYYIKRTSRIIPTYYVLVIVLAACGSEVIYGGQSGLSLWEGLGVFLLFLQNYLANQGCGPIWFLAVIFHAYILLPLIFIALRHLLPGKISDKIGVITACVVVGSLLLRTVWILWGAYGSNDFMFTHFRMDAFFIGMFLFFSIRKNSRLVKWVRKHSVISTAFCLTIIAIAMFCSRGTVYTFSVGYSLLAIAYGGIIILLTQPAANRASTKFRPFFPIAKYSFGIYLWHWYLIHIFGAHYLKFFEWIAAFEIGAIPSTLLQILVFIGISLFVGLISTLCIEQPFYRLLAGRSKTPATSPKQS